MRSLQCVFSSIIFCPVFTNKTGKSLEIFTKFSISWNWKKNALMRSCAYIFEKHLKRSLVFSLLRNQGTVSHHRIARSDFFLNKFCCFLDQKFQDVADLCGGFSFQFCDLAKLTTTTRKFSQIWRYIICENRKFYQYFYIFATCWNQTIFLCVKFHTNAIEKTKKSLRHAHLVAYSLFPRE